MDGSRVKGSGRGRPLLDLDADDPRVAADVEVLVLDVSQAVGEVGHGAVGELDVELLAVEVDVELMRVRDGGGTKHTHNYMSHCCALRRTNR